MEETEEVDIEYIVKDYLLKMGYSKSFATFIEETKTHSIDPDNTNDINTLIQYFYQGDKDEFFEIWNSLISNSHKEKPIETQKLEFYLMVYFAVFPIHPMNPKGPDLARLEREIKNFKHFIENEGSQISKTPEFLAYYALPFVKDLEVFYLYIIATPIIFCVVY